MISIIIIIQLFARSYIFWQQTVCLGLGGHVVDEVHHTTAVSKLVVIPTEKNILL